MSSEAFSTYAAGTQHDGATARPSVEADGRDHELAQAVGSAVRLDFVADLHRRIDGVWCGAGEDGPVSEQHRCGSVFPIAGKSLVDQGCARGHCRGQCGCDHDRHSSHCREELVISRAGAPSRRAIGESRRCVVTPGYGLV